METKIETKLVPVTVNRKVKTLVVELTQKEALLIRDIIGGCNVAVLARAAKNSNNFSKISDLDQAEKDIMKLTEQLDQFARQVKSSK